MQVEELFDRIYDKVDTNEVKFFFGSDCYVKKWLCSDILEQRYSPFLNFKEPYFKEGACNPLIFTGKVGNKEFKDLKWSVFYEDTSLLVHLNQANRSDCMIYSAFCVVSTKVQKAIVTLYNKQDLKIWHGNDLIYVNKCGIKNINDFFVIHLKKGKNYFLIEKSTQSISIKFLEYTESLKTMGRYLSSDFVDSNLSELNIVTDSYIYEKPKISLLIIPKDFSKKSKSKINIAIFKNEDCVNRTEIMPLEKVDIEILEPLRGKIKIEAVSKDNRSLGAEYVYIGDVGNDLESLRKRLSLLTGLNEKATDDLNCHLSDLLDIYTLRETAVYESRMMFLEEIRALIEGLESVGETVGKLEEDSICLFDRKRGLVVNSYSSCLDNKKQYYYAYIPENYDSFRSYPVLVVLKYLYKRVQIPGFLFYEGKKHIKNDDIIVLSPIGRGINRYEVAGEIDLMEALEDLQKRYNIDKDKIFLCGFSMGGGACWNLAQKYPSVFKGIITSSSNLNEKFNCNLVNTKIVYINGELDTMFDSVENYLKMEIFKKSMPNGYIENILLKKTGHFELYTIYKDRRTLQWVRENRTAIIPKRIHFKTDSLRYSNSYWITIDDIVDPSLDSEIEAEVKGSSINIETANIKKLRLHQAVMSEYGIDRLVLNGSRLRIDRADEPEVIIDKVQSNAPIVLSDFKVRYGEYRSKNVCGLGLAEVYYDRLAVIAYSSNDSKVNAIVKKIASSFSRPIYYGEFRERYAEIPVFSGDVDIPSEFLNGNLILIGDENQGLIKKTMEELGNLKIIEALKINCGSEVFGLFIKVPSIFNGDKRIVLKLIYKANELEQYKDTDIFKGKFSYPFSVTRDLMRNDAVIFTSCGIYSCYMDTAWNILELKKYECL